MKKNFSKNLQSILKLAKEEAIRLGHSYVGSEHLLIGLLKIKTGTSKKIFDREVTNTNSIKLNLNSGIYLLKVSNDHRVVNSKIIIK